MIELEFEFLLCRAKFSWPCCPLTQQTDFAQQDFTDFENRKMTTMMAIITIQIPMTASPSDDLNFVISVLLIRTKLNFLAINNGPKW